MSDGFGELLRDCWEAGPRPGAFAQVIERDDGFVSIEDAYRYFTPPEEWITAEQRAVELARGRVLDVGCAAGRHMLKMVEECQVVGIDPSPGAVQVAQKQGLDARLGTILKPGEIGTFDTIVLLGGNLGLLGSADQAPAVLASLAGLARPGTRLLAVGHDPYTTTLPEHLAYHECNRTVGRLPGQIRMRVRYRARASDWIHRLRISAGELAELVNESAWTLEHYSPPCERGFFLAELHGTPVL